MTYSILGTDTTTNERIELSQSSRREGMYILGATGTGKSTLLENLILQDIKQGLGVCVLDPHGELINSVVSRMKKRLEDVIILDLMDEKHVFGMDLFHWENTADPFVEDLAVTRVMHILEKVYQISRGTPQMNQYFINITRTLLYNPEYTILDIPWILTNDNLRTKLVNNVPDAWVRWFWNDFFENYQRGVRRADAISSVVNKLDEFFRRVPRPIFGQTNTTINLREIMDNRKILLVKLHARFDSLTNLVGSIIISHLLDAAYSRSDTPEKKRKQFNVYADEFQRFAIQDFATLFTEARKYGLSLTIAHQVRDQIDPIIKATCDQAASIVSFRASSDNAKEIAGVFDTTPPPGEWIYEKIMRRAGAPYNVEVWETPELEEEYHALGKQIEKIEQKHFADAEKYNKSEVLLPVSAPLPSQMTPALWKIVEERFMPWFRPFVHDKEVEEYLRSLFERVSIPVRRGRKHESSYVSYHLDFQRKKHEFGIAGSAISFSSLAYLVINQHIQSNTPYAFPAHFRTELDANDSIQVRVNTAFQYEVQEMYAQFKPYARYYFDVKEYDAWSLKGRYADDKNLEFSPHVLLAPWKGPYFRSDADWLFILNWFYQKAKLLLTNTTQIQELTERRNELFREHHKIETRTQWLDWYEPEPIMEWEYLKWARGLGEEVFVGDNCKYRARLGNPPYGSDEVEKRNANKITHLPKHHACIRIETGEHSIATIKPEGGMSDKALAERIAAIQEQNKMDGYLQLRSDVEKQILAHHESLLIPSPASNGNGKQQRKVTPPVEQATPDEAPPKKRPKIV